MAAPKTTAPATDKWVKAALRRVDEALAPLRAITPETNPVLVATLLEGLTPEQLERAGDPMGLALAAEEARANAAALRAQIADGHSRDEVDTGLAHGEIRMALANYIGHGAYPEHTLSQGQGYGGAVHSIMRAAFERLPAMPKRRGGSR